MNLQDGEPFDVLVICTANICRSPMAEGLLRRTGPHARVSSAGFLRDGSPPAPDAARAVQELGVDISAHRSRIVDADMVRRADLVLTMERSHARELVILEPEARHRIFTIRSFALALGRRSRLDERPLADLLDELNRNRPAGSLTGAGPDDLPDPYGRRFKHFRTTAEELAGHAQLVGRVLAAAARATSPGDRR